MNIASLYDQLVYNENKPLINVVFDTPFTKEIRIVMKKGQVMKEHKTTYPIVVNIVEGKVDFGVNGEVFHLQKGDLIWLEGSVPHDLKTLEDAIVRLTLTKADHIDRVERVID